MKDETNNPEKPFVLSGYGFFARFVHLPASGFSEGSGKVPQTESKKEVGHD